MKAVAFFWGSDSAGREVEVAQSESGVWFHRVKEWNGFQVAFCKWTTLQAAPSHPTESYNEITNSVVVFSAEESANMINWGFSGLNKTASVPRVRLPA